MDCSLPRFSIHGIFQARILEWVAISFSRASSQPRDWTRFSCIVGRCFTVWATKAVLGATRKPEHKKRLCLPFFHLCLCWLSLDLYYHLSNYNRVPCDLCIGFYPSKLCNTLKSMSLKHTSDYAAAKSLQSCPTLCDPMDWSLPGSSVHGIFQARGLEWVAIAIWLYHAWKKVIT